MHRDNLKGITVFILAFVSGWLLSLRTWDGLVYFVFEGDRQPAAVARSFDLSHLQGEALRDAAHRRLLSEANAFKGEKGIGVRLGHFIARGPDGTKKLACQIYEKVEMTFVADGVAESGEAPLMIVEGPCAVDKKDINHISAIWVPIERVLNEKPGDMELSFYDENDVTLKFDHIGLQWPKNWSLQSVRLYSASYPNLETVIDEEQVREVSPHALELNW